MLFAEVLKDGPVDEARDSHGRWTSYDDGLIDEHGPATKHGGGLIELHLPAGSKALPIHNTDVGPQTEIVVQHGSTFVVKAAEHHKIVAELKP